MVWSADAGYTGTMLDWSVQIARVFGIPIRLHVSLVLLLPFLVLDLGWLAATIVGLSLATSIVLHELGHSLVAVRHGGHVREILLMPIGGAARLDHMSMRPRDELLMALAGPAVSLTVFVVLFLGGAVLPMTSEQVVLWGLRLTVNLVQVIGLINLVLGLFNLLPAFPMDGGRVLRALLVRRFGRLNATRAAARVGRTIAAGLACFAAWEWATGASFSMLLFVALFIYWAAGMEYRAVHLQEWRKRHSGVACPSWSGAPDHVVTVPPSSHRPEEAGDLPSGVRDPQDSGGR